MNKPEIIVLDGAGDDDLLEEKPEHPVPNMSLPGDVQAPRLATTAILAASTLTPVQTDPTASSTSLRSPAKKKLRTQDQPAIPAILRSRQLVISLSRSIKPQEQRFVKAQWQPRVVHLKSNFNPDQIALPSLTALNRVSARRYVDTASAATPSSAYSVLPLTVQPREGSQDRIVAIVATKAIPAGRIIGEYLGRMTLEPPRCDRVRNRGYRLVMHESPKSCGSWRARIDAEVFGSLMRFVNHSCKPSSAFHEVSNGRIHTMVVATSRDVKAGEEVTVDYGDDLWFICKCGQPNCCHKDIQHLTNPQ